MASITLLYKNNRMAVLNCLGEDIQAAHSLKIYGTEGSKKNFFLIQIIIF